MRSVFVIIAIVSTLISNSQVIFRLSDSDKRTVSKPENFISNSYIVTDNNSWISSSESLDQPDEVTVNYKSKGLAFMLIETSGDGSTWEKGPSITLAQSANESTGGAFLKSSKKVYLKFTLFKSTTDSLVLTDITVSKKEPERVVKKDDQTIERKIDSLIEKNNINDLKFATEALSGEYDEMLEKVVELSSSNDKLVILSDLSQFLINRTSMANPIRYSAFNNLLDSVKDAAGGLDRLLIEQLKSSLAVDLEKKTGKATGFVNTLYNIGNLITGGRLTTVFSSVKEIFARTYSQGNLLLSYIQQPASNAFEFISQKREDPKIQVNATVMAEIARKSESAIKRLREIDEFMKVLDIETGEIDFLLLSFKEVGRRLENFDENLFTYLKEEVFPDIENGLQKTDYDALKVNSPKTLKYLKEETGKNIKKINQLLDSRNAKNLADAKEEIKKLTQRLDGLSKLQEKYYDNVYQLYFGCNNIKQSLNRENPFSTNPLLSAYAAEWKVMNDKASQSIADVPDGIKRQYITKVKNTLAKFGTRE